MFQRLFSAACGMDTELVVRSGPALEDSPFIAASSVPFSKDLLASTLQ